MKIGIAGGIGSGKSYVCRRIEQLGFQVYDCDSAAKRLIRTSPEIRERLTALIGPDVYNRQQGADGQEEYILNKSVVAKFLLASASNARAVDAIVHPAVFRDFQESGLQWMESALMFDSGADSLVDKVIAVVAPKEIRIQRVMERDHISREKVLEWMNRQMDQEEIIQRADYVIVNDGQKDIDQQLKNIIRQCNRSF
jgi:dephospho-CoA kinase